MILIYFQDAKNYDGETFESLLHGQQLHDLVNPVKFTPLKCLSARIIQKHKLPYVTEVPASLYGFIESH